ncbi:MAG: DUF502 domain-containing protein [Deltaproteobacteria bacterium]|nr:DUF502 domain-containing protein [Deltaproteobacteria bacterium]
MSVRDVLKKQAAEFGQAVRKDFRSLFLTGLLVIIPVWVTYLTIRFLIGIADDAVLILPPSLRPENLLGFHIPGSGLVVAIFVILLAGFVARNVLGKKLVGWGEEIIAKIPLVRSVYSAIKKFTYTILGNSQNFQRAVLIEYPRRDAWTIGFVTNRAEKSQLSADFPEDMLAVFVTTTPNPTSGWVVFVPERDCIPLDMSVEEAFRIVVSGGVVMPDGAEARGEAAAGNEARS